MGVFQYVPVFLSLSCLICAVQASPPMPSAHSYTVDDDDDSDICPVCDGECTCTKPASLPPSTPGLSTGPLSMAELSLRYANASSPSPQVSKPKPAPPPPPPTVQKPSLKIKLTLPQSLLAKRRAGSSESPAPPAPVAGPSHHSHTPYLHRPTTTQPKKRGRPPKSLAHQSSVSPPAAARPYKALPHKQPAAQHLKRPPPSAISHSNKVRQNLKARAGKKAAAAKRRHVVSSDEDESSSDYFNDVEMEHSRPSMRPAYATKSNIKSEGPSDNEMDVDSDATEDEDDEKEQADDEDADATEEDATVGAMDPALAVSLGLAMEEDDATTTDDHRYVGHATGWSDDDESSFDADLFFAHLSDSSSSSSSAPSSPAQRHHRLTTPFSGATPKSLSLGEEGDQSDISGALSDGTEAPGRHRPSHFSHSFFNGSRQLESMPFELTESWNGEIMFTNGKDDGRNMVDLEFEANAAERFRGPGFVVDENGARHTYPYQNLSLGMEGNDWTGTPDAFGGSGLAGPFGGADASMFFGGTTDEEDIMSDEGYLEEDDGEGEGDTTDEELVGADDLPNERAMRLFSLPQSVSAINPLSTVSSPANSPGGHALYGYGRIGRSRKASRLGNGSLVRPADILEGRVATFWDSDELEHDRDDLGMLTARQERVWGRKEGGVVEKKRKRESKGKGKEKESLYAKEHGRKDNRDKKGSWRRKDRDNRRLYEGIKEEEEEMMGMEEEDVFGYRAAEHAQAHSSVEEDASSGSPGTSPPQPSAIHFRGPRKGVFATPSANETRLAVIAEDKKGGAVPSPHPRFNKRRGRGRAVSAVDDLLRKHILQSLTAANINTASGLALNNSISIPAPPAALMQSSATSTPQPPPLDTPLCLANGNNNNNECSPFEQLLQMAAGHSVPTSPISGVEGATGPMMLMQLCERTQEAEPIDLDDVLDASFLDGPCTSAMDMTLVPSSDAASSSTAPSSSATPDVSYMEASGSGDSTERDQTTPVPEMDAAKDLSRWDHISVGAFRQTHERGWDAGALVADNAIRSSPLAAMMWQQNNPTTGALGMLRTGSAGMLKSDKLAKRRRLMMSASTMSSPLVLPSASAAAFNGGGAGPSTPGGFSSGMSSKSGTPTPLFQEEVLGRQQQQHQQHQKNRKELRRERKLMKRVASGGSLGSLSAHRHHPHHQFHAHHHHPNTKSRSTGSVQRSHGGFLAAVPPLNL
ncbi:hypothetical protein D9619_006110 [Psilocybe cf. subviscida]|uniref:Uncharacterized protein n=1 Tax=Psilocybe cf. subviscida TaxID=2480587 RepID=A0A8H5EXB9_9AGAR|nr:hypothetical protein D9619_006110 [Psilocybe cf. subviscida]